MLNAVLEDLEDMMDGDNEICSVSITEYFNDYQHLIDCGYEVYESRKNPRLIQRKANELHYHNFLEHQLFSHLQEMKYYSDVNIFDTRRLVAVSPDCISMIQILVRDKIHLMVHFRSSDFDGALPADLEFISKLPGELIDHLEFFRGKPGYEEIDIEAIENLTQMPVELHLSFGSLHRTI